MHNHRDIASILLHNPPRHFLLQHRTNDALVRPGYWGFFGGGIDPGETPEQAVSRETYEELSYTLKNPRFLFTRDYQNEKNYGKRHVFVEEYDQTAPLHLHEGQALGWFSAPQARNLQIIPEDLVVLLEAESYIITTKESL